MALSISGYVLDPPRVGAANSPFTLTPNNLISNQAAFDLAFPSDESAPRVEYLVQVKDEGQLPGTGPDNARSLLDAVFFWTKNEGVVQDDLQIPFQRFDYSGQDQRFKTLQGAPRELLGSLQTDSNTERLVVSSVPQIEDLVNFPIRVAVGPFGSSTTFDVTLVDLDTAFGTPAVGEVELSLETGNLNWNAADLTTYEGLSVAFQRQGFFFPGETNGSLGVIGTDDFILNPLPATGQRPLIKFGFGDFVTATEVTSFSANPTAGTVEWHRDTGELKLNSGDLVTFGGQVLIYDGATFAEFQVSTQAVGTLGTPGTVGPTPLDENEDLFFVVPNEVQFPETVFVDTLTTPGKRGQVQIRRSDGQVRFSTTDQGQYGGGTSVFVARPDVEIEKGHSLRLFRTPVDLAATDSDIKDVTALYPSIGAVLADPMIGQPSVFLPAVPRDDLTIEVRVEQGTGTFTGTLQRLDVGTPTVGKGYALDFDQRLLLYGERKEDEILDAPTSAFGAIQLPNSPVFNTGLSVELENNAGVGDFVPLVEGQDFTIERLSGLITFTQTDGVSVVTGSQASLSGSTLTDTTQNFPVSGVSVGDYLVVLTGPSEGVYLITSVSTTTLDVSPDFPAVDTDVAYEILQDKEILADRYFREVPLVDPNTSVERLVNLGTITNSPRLNFNPALENVSRIRLGTSTFIGPIIEVPDDASFTPPALLSSGDVEFSVDTGNLNFSSVDVATGEAVYWARELTYGSEYTIQPGLGFIEFSERMLEGEEVYLTYATLDEEGNKVLVEERGVFLVSKELTQSHPAPTTTLSYNPLGREVAASPSPSAFRGGRPQVTGTQVLFNTDASTVTFIETVTVTDALPSGSTVGPEENVYVDYYVYGAIGGEKNLTVQQLPMAILAVSIEEGATEFLIEGDHTAVFKDQYLLRVDSEVYLLGPSTFDSTNTTVTLDQTAPQVFRSDQANPPLELTSGPTRREDVGLLPSYFETEAAAFDTVPRGSTSFRLAGDLTTTYVGGTVVMFSDDTNFQDFLLVEGSTFEDNRTTVVLASNGSRQYSSLVTLRRSARPILSSASADVYTSRAPVLELPYRLFRQVEGEVGVLLVAGVDYTIDASGKVTFTEPLALEEELSIFYTGITTIAAGRRTRVSWSFALVPTVDNGLLNQILVMDYTTYSPDTFFYRVETMTNFRGEMAQQFEDEAKANSPSQGPILENSAGARLFEQGNESLYYQEGYLANQDLVAVPTLQFYNEIVNHLEDYLQQADGRVVGDRDGRFLFDGLLDNPVRATFADATNQIDDSVTIFGSTTVEAYQASAFSRFFPTQRRTPGQVDPTGLVTGDPIFFVGYKPIQSVNLVQRRYPFALVTAATETGGTSLTVDIADGDPLYFRPPFDTGMTVRIIDQDGTVLDSGLTVGAVTPTSIEVSAVGTYIPDGATVTLDPADTVYKQTYLVGVDLKVNANDGLVLYVEAGDIFLPFTAKTIEVDERWDTISTATHQDTEPFRFPALDGGVSDDDGDIQTAPLLNPQARSERAISPFTGSASGTGLLSRLQTFGASVVLDTQAPYTGLGSLNGAGTIITLNSGTFPSPVPEVNDLVRILTGVNGPSTFRRITAATANSVTVTDAFTTDSNFTFLVTVSNSVESGSGTISPTTRLTDAAALFITNGVVVGQTVVVTSGSNSGRRRQVTAVVSETELDVIAFSSTGAGNYRVDQPLSTFGGVGSTQALLADAVDDELGVLDTDTTPLVSEREALENYIDTVAGPDKVTSTTGAPSGTTLTDASENFVTSNVAPGDYIFVRTGANAGFYEVDSVTNANNLVVTEAFPSGATTSYRIFNVALVSLEGLNLVSTALQNVDAMVSALTSFATLSSTQVAVVGDAGAFALGWTTTDFSTASGIITSRASTVDSDRGNISAILTSIDRLYDARFVWIDGRINLETGILVKQTRAVQNREKALAKIIKDLTKLLTV